MQKENSSRDEFLARPLHQANQPKRYIHLCLQNVQNKLFPILVKLPNFLSLKHIFKLSATPKWKGHDFMGKLHGDAPNED